MCQSEYKIRRVSINHLKGNEILGKDIMTNNGTVLMSSGVTIKPEYINRLNGMDIQYVYIKDDLTEGIKVDPIIELQVKEECTKAVKEIIQKYFNNSNEELKKLKNVADDIILDVLEEPEVMFNIYGIRKKSEGAFSHSVNVCTLSVLLALNMKFSEDRVRDIAIGSLLHDIGLQYVPFDLKSLKYDEFTTQELKEIKKHVVYGYSAIENEDWLCKLSKEIIISHHECIDGSGYPFHYKKEQLSIACRIVSVCDMFDNLVYGNYIESMKVHKAVEYIISQAGIKFDFRVVKVFNESVAAYPNGTIVITNEGEQGVVLRQNPKCPTRPIIRMVLDKDGNKYNDWIEKDLTKELTLFVVDTLE